MTFLTDPIVVTPTGWLQRQAHVERTPVAPVPGTTGAQAHIGWISPLRAAVRLLGSILRAVPPVSAVPPLAAVSWLQARLTLYDRAMRHTPPLALVEAR